MFETDIFGNLDFPITVQPTSVRPCKVKEGSGANDLLVFLSKCGPSTFREFGSREKLVSRYCGVVRVRGVHVRVSMAWS